MTNDSVSGNVGTGASESSSQQIHAKPVEAPAPSNLTLIEKADAVAKRMEEANKKAEELIRRQEEITARMLLSGRAEAGQIQKSPEQANEEEAQKQANAIIKRFRR